MAVDDIFIVNAPFTPRQVVNLWHFQSSDDVHPFTCRQRGDHPELNGDKGVLIPTTRGWICQFCDYTQDWAHDLMVDFDQRPKVQAPQPSSLSEREQSKWPHTIEWPKSAYGAELNFARILDAHGNVASIISSSECGLKEVADMARRLSDSAGLERELLAALRVAHKAACWGECEINLVDGQHVGHHEPAYISRAALIDKYKDVVL